MKALTGILFLCALLILPLTGCAGMATESTSESVPEAGGAGGVTPRPSMLEQEPDCE